MTSSGHQLSNQDDSFDEFILNILLDHFQILTENRGHTQSDRAIYLPSPPEKPATSGLEDKLPSELKDARVVR